VRGADAPIGVPAVPPVLAARLAGHPLAAATKVPGRTVTGAPLEVAQPAVQTGAGPAGSWNANMTQGGQWGEVR
jgi:hypothetical protein